MTPTLIRAFLRQPNCLADANQSDGEPLRVLVDTNQLQQPQRLQCHRQHQLLSRCVEGCWSAVELRARSASSGRLHLASCLPMLIDVPRKTLWILVRLSANSMRALVSMST